MNINQNILNSYSVSNEDFTTREEMNFIENNLLSGANLKDLTKTMLKEIRNEVVTFYSDKMKNKFDSKTNNNMMSVTAIIDNIIYRF